MKLYWQGDHLSEAEEYLDQTVPGLPLPPKLLQNFLRKKNGGVLEEFLEEFWEELEEFFFLPSLIFFLFYTAQ